MGSKFQLLSPACLKVFPNKLFVCPEYICRSSRLPLLCSSEELASSAKTTFKLLTAVFLIYNYKNIDKSKKSSLIIVLGLKKLYLSISIMERLLIVLNRNNDF